MGTGIVPLYPKLNLANLTDKRGVYNLYTLDVPKIRQISNPVFFDRVQLWNLIVNPAIWCIQYIHQVIYCLLKKERPIHNHHYVQCMDALIKISPKLGRLTEFRKVELDNHIVGLTYNRTSKHCLVGNLQDTEQNVHPCNFQGCFC